jgi:hypothetical protein
MGRKRCLEVGEFGWGLRLEKVGFWVMMFIQVL